MRLRPILAPLPSGAVIDDSDELRDALTSLEFLLPEVLQELHPEWKEEGLDGIYPELLRKLGDDEIELVGLCILISDQTLIPLHLRLQLDLTDDCVSWFECRIGESVSDGMLRVPYNELVAHGTRLAVMTRLGSIKWVYRVGFGEPRCVIFGRFARSGGRSRWKGFPLCPIC